MRTKDIISCTAIFISGVIALIDLAIHWTPADDLAAYIEDFGEDEGLARWQAETVSGRLAKWRARA